MRLSVQLLVVLMVLNGIGTGITATGLAENTPLEGPPESSDINQLEEETRDRPEFGGGALQSLFGFYSAAASWWNTATTFLTAGPGMFKTIGLPAWFVDNLVSPIMYFYITADLIYVATQRSL